MTQEEQIDHRWSLRRPLHVDVSLLKHDQTVLAGKTRDFSIGGMFVETKKPMLQRDIPIHVAFTLETEAGASHHRLPAQVIRVANDGVGLMFNDFNVDTVHTLRAMLYGNHMA